MWMKIKPKEKDSTTRDCIIRHMMDLCQDAMLVLWLLLFSKVTTMPGFLRQEQTSLNLHLRVSLVTENVVFEMVFRTLTLLILVSVCLYLKLASKF